MAYRHGQISAALAAGAMALAVVPALAALFGAGIQAAPNWDYLLQALRFTLLQASLSTALSAGLALPVALSLFHRRFRGREWLLQLFAVPQSLPPLVAALGLLSLFGQAGLIPGMPSIYGLSGILLAHVFFNLPFAARLMLNALETIPAESWRLSAQLGMGRREVFRLIEWPVLKAALPGIAGLIFMLCVTSFTLVLTLGGGPRSATLEVVIYQALRFDYDPGLALTVSLAQLALCAGLMAFAQYFAAPAIAGPSLGLRGAGPGRSHWSDAPVLAAAGLFVAAPLAAVVIAGLKADLAGLLAAPSTWAALGTSAAIAAASALFALSLALPLSLRAARGGKAAGLLGQLPLLLPPVLLGAGWFLLSRGAWPALFVILGNGLMALPFAMQALVPAMAAARADDRLCEALGIGGFSRFLRIDLPPLKRAMALALLMAMMVSFGDLGLIAFFGASDFTTLPYLLYQRLGSYRSADAQGLALILFALALGLAFVAGQLQGRRHDQA